MNLKEKNRKLIKIGWIWKDKLSYFNKIKKVKKDMKFFNNLKDFKTKRRKRRKKN